VQVIRSRPARIGLVVAVVAVLVGAATILLLPGDTDPTGRPGAADPAPGGDAGPDRPGPTGNGGAPTAGLPGSLVGVMPEAHGHIGPYVDGNGNLYTVIEDFAGTGENEPKAMRSTDGGATWAEIDPGGRPSTGDLEADWLIQVGTNLYFGYQKSNGSVFLTAFRTSDAPVDPDTWSIVKEKLHDPKTEPADQWVSLAPVGNGDVWVFYSTDTTSEHGHRAGFRKRSQDTGEYSAEVILDPARAVSQVVTIAGAEVTHVFYKDHVEQHVFYRSLSADGGLSPAVQVDTGRTHPVYSPMTNAVVHPAGGAELVTVAWADPSGVLRAATVDGGTAGEPQRLSDVPTVIDPGSTTNRGAVAHLAADGSTVHAVYADLVTQDIWFDTLVEDVGWGTDVEIADGLQTQWLTGLLAFTNRGGLAVLGYIYDTGPHGDDGGIIRYDEFRRGS
jgi:hypothetical protein